MSDKLVNSEPHHSSLISSVSDFKQIYKKIKFLIFISLLIINSSKWQVHVLHWAFIKVLKYTETSESKARVSLMDKDSESAGTSLLRNKYLEVLKAEYVQYPDELGLVLSGVGTLVDGVHQPGEGPGVESLR